MANTAACPVFTPPRLTFPPATHLIDDGDAADVCAVNGVVDDVEVEIAEYIDDVFSDPETEELDAGRASAGAESCAAGW